MCLCLYLGFLAEHVLFSCRFFPSVCSLQEHPCASGVVKMHYFYGFFFFNAPWTHINKFDGCSCCLYSLLSIINFHSFSSFFCFVFFYDTIQMTEHVFSDHSCA